MGHILKRGRVQRDYLFFLSFHKLLCQVDDKPWAFEPMRDSWRQEAV